MFQMERVLLPKQMGDHYIEHYRDKTEVANEWHKESDGEIIQRILKIQCINPQLLLAEHC